MRPEPRVRVSAILRWHDEKLAHPVVGRREGELLAPLGGDGEAGRDQVALALPEVVRERLARRRDHQLQADTQGPRELPHQLVLEAELLPAVEEVRGARVPGEHPERPALPDRVEIGVDRAVLVAGQRPLHEESVERRLESGILLPDPPADQVAVRNEQYTPSLEVLQPRQVSDWMVSGDCRYTTIAWLWTRSSSVRPCTPSSASSIPGPGWSMSIRRRSRASCSI